MTNHLNGYLQRWKLRDPELMAQSPRGDVYLTSRNSEKVVLKLFTPVGAEDECEGAAALRYFDGCGAVRLLDYDEKAHLLEYIEGEQLAEMVWRGEDLAAAEIIADVLNKLHRSQPDVPMPRFRTLRRRFRDLFSRAARDKTEGKRSIYVRGAEIAEHLLATSQDECVLHGDIHHHNIRWHPGRGWLAYDPKGLYGERCYDAANTLCNPSNARDRVMSEDRFLGVSQVLANVMDVRIERLRAYAFAYACLSAAWFGDDDDSDVKHQILTVARNAERHVDI